MNSANLLEAMKERLRWNKSDPVVLTQMADLYEEAGDEKKVNELRIAVKVAETVRDAVQKMKELDELYKREKATVMATLMITRKLCPHPVTKYYPDASGNNDSTTECLCCGADI